VELETDGSPEKGIPEKEWAFDLDLWGKIVPSVRNGQAEVEYTC